MENNQQFCGSGDLPARNSQNVLGNFRDSILFGFHLNIAEIQDR